MKVNIKTRINSDGKQEERQKQKHRTRQIENLRFAFLVGDGTDVFVLAVREPSEVSVGFE